MTTTTENSAAPAPQDLLEKAAEIIEELIACHDEPTCPAVAVGEETVLELRAARAVAGAPQVAAWAWQPIETAPKDGTRILLYFPVFGNSPRVEAGRWELQKHGTKPKPYWSGDCERVYGVMWYRESPPTHWMPLPAAPGAALSAPQGAPAPVLTDEDAGMLEQAAVMLETYATELKSLGADSASASAENSASVVRKMAVALIRAEQAPSPAAPPAPQGAPVAAEPVAWQSELTGGVSAARLYFDKNEPLIPLFPHPAPIAQQAPPATTAAPDTALVACIDALESATSFTSKKARDNHQKIIKAARAALASQQGGAA